jgi:benzoate/toluate 1,2-dioxygenase beta subunit
VARPHAEGLSDGPAHRPRSRSRTCERFIDEARLLDDRFRDWLALFTDDGAYWVPAERDQPTPHGRVSLFYDDRHS